MPSRTRRTFPSKLGFKVFTIVFFSAFFLVFRSCPLSGNAAKQSAPHKSTTRSNSTEVAEVEKYCTEIQGLTSKREPDFVFGLPSSTDKHEAQWQKFASTAELKKASEDAEAILEQQVYVWTEGGKVIAANFTLQSESGDWALYPDYCFRKNGAVAEISSELRTFYGMMIIRRAWVFDSKGDLLKSTEEFLDLKTKKPKKPGPDDEFIDESTPVYHGVADLPFLSLLPEHRHQP